MQNYVHRGETLTVTAPYTVVTGQGVLAGNLFGVAVFSAASGASLEIVTWGVYDLAKDGSTFNPGDKVYWDLSLIHISEPTRQAEISYAVFCLKKKKKKER